MIQGNRHGPVAEISVWSNIFKILRSPSGLQSEALGVQVEKVRVVAHLRRCYT